MWTVRRPEDDAEETYQLCISRVRDAVLKRRLASISDDIAIAAMEYAILAQRKELHRVPQTDGVAGEVSTDEMVDNYDSRMAGRRAPGRRIYDALMSLPEQGICPYCNHGIVSTLDHVLPKKLFPALAVAPDNLVGACKDCNTAKGSTAPGAAEDATLHPYFDNVSRERWLGARVVVGPVAAVLFFPIGIETWADELNSRIRSQFELLNLGPRYSNLAAREIAGHRKNIIRIFEASGEHGIRAELRYKSDTWDDFRHNSWQAATFRALSESDWYCRDGFRNR